MDSQPGLISSVVYTYLSLLPFHVGPTLQIANMGNGRQACVRTTLKVQSYLQKRAR